VPHLVVVPASGPTEFVALREDRAVLGRSRDCHVILPDVLLSRRHAELVRDAEGWEVRDLGSLNGTRVNGAKLAAPARLREGDEIQVSDWTLVFRESDAPEGAPPPTDSGPRLRDITDLATRTDLEAGALGRQSHVLGVLTRAAASVVAIPTAAELLDALLGHLLDAVPARRGMVALYEGETRVPIVAAARAIEGTPPQAVDPGVSERLLRAGTPFLAPRVTTEDGTVCSLLCAPLWFGGAEPGSDRVGGCVALEGTAEPTPFVEEHLQFVTAIANLAASRLESLRLRVENADKRRLDEDLRGAARIQASLLPEETRVPRAWELAGSSRLCSAVGADYYDYTFDDSTLLLALGDVAGKGLAAALLMAALRAAVRALWRERIPLAQVVAGVNGSLCQTVPANRYATLFLGRLDTKRGGLAWVNAGHSPALLVRADGRHASLEEGGTILGAFPGTSWKEGRATLGRGDVLVLVSDGVMEAARTASGQLGSARLAALVGSARGGSASAILAALQTAADEGSVGERRVDDHTFLVVRRKP
jgi:sigma-B regulation protein RsbU (phosphoserine phosphatase)